MHPEKNISFLDLADQHKVNADKKLIGRIFNNIVLNAFQAMHKAERPKLQIELTNTENYILISFADIGMGISDEIKEKVFVPNFSTKNAGSGIGLAIAKRGIEHAGGDIWFESEEGKGTVFYIKLPTIG